MKVLIDHCDPFLLAHGGFQIQIEQSARAIRENGIDVEFLRWWDPEQKGDIIHYFGRPLPNYVEAAHTKEIKVVFTPLHTATGSRSAWKLGIQYLMTRLAQHTMPEPFLFRLAWASYREADACILATEWEATLVRRLYQPGSDRLHVVPNGVDSAFRVGTSAERGKWLVTTAAVSPRKRVVETARAAVAAKTPYWLVGKPFSESDPYYQEWLALCKKYPEWIRYEGAIADRAQLAAVYRQARGFVLLSHAESLSLSATEAAGCGCPLLLSDLRWARSAFGSGASYCPIAGTEATASRLRWFYDQAPSLPGPPPQKTWPEVGRMFKDIYESITGKR